MQFYILTHTLFSLPLSLNLYLCFLFLALSPHLTCFDHAVPTCRLICSFGQVFFLFFHYHNSTHPFTLHKFSHFFSPFFFLHLKSAKREFKTKAFASFAGMGRVKLKIKKLENTNGRQATYAKRKHGIMKKANELSILCDIDIILLMFSPTGKPSICNGKRSSIEEVIAKFAQLTPQERAKRKLESLEALKKTFKKLEHDVNVQEFLGTSTHTIEDLTNQTRLLQTQLSEIHRRLSYWTNPDKINNIEHLGQMENSIRESLNHIQAQKENLGKQQLMSLECSSQFPNGMHIPFRLGSEQHLQPLSWIPNNDNRHMVLPEDPNLLPHRDLECSASSSFGSYSGYFGTNKSSEISNSGHEGSLLSELSGTASLRLQLGGQGSYLPYNIDMLNDKFQQPVAEMNLPENTLNYQVSGSLEAPTGYDTSWGSTSASGEVNIYDGRLYAQLN